MRIAVDSVEVQTLKPDGRPWDGPGGPRIPHGELASFFQLDLTRQLDRLVEDGPPPTPPDLIVRVYAGKELLLQTTAVKSFDPRYSDAPAECAVAAGATVKIEVWDEDVMFDDNVGTTSVAIPAAPADGKWVLGPFGQVRRLTLRLG
jgi:hypothetical protein